MIRIALALGVAGLLLVSAAHSAERSRYSGHIVNVSPNGQTITLQELGARAGTQNQVIDRALGVTPDTRLTLAARAEEDGGGDWSGGFKESPLSVTDLRVGDYATVEAEARDGRLVAVSVLVVRPTGQTN